MGLKIGKYSESIKALFVQEVKRQSGFLREDPYDWDVDIDLNWNKSNQGQRFWHLINEVRFDEACEIFDYHRWYEQTHGQSVEKVMSNLENLLESL